MTDEQAEDVIFGIFKDAWDPRPAVYDDVPGNIPTSESIWARASIRPATGRQSSLQGEQGNRKFTTEGTVMVQVFAPVGDGSTACKLAAQEVRDAFRDARNSGVWFRDARVNKVGASGAFTQFNVLVTYSYDETR
jgi:hypothetical protein